MAEFATVARPYAKALYGLAGQYGQTRVWGDDLALLAKIVVEPKVSNVLSRPELSPAQRGEILLNLLSTDKMVDKRLHNFVSVLSENNRLSVLPAIYEQYREFMLSEERTQQAVVYSAFPLSDQEYNDLVSLLEERMDTKLQVRVEIDPALIGGVKIEVGDQVLDMSVQNKLNALKAAVTN